MNPLYSLYANIIPRVNAKKFFGEMASTQSQIESSHWVSWWLKTKEHLEEKEVQVKLFDKKVTKVLQIFNREFFLKGKAKDVTKDFEELLRHGANLGKIPDDFFQFWNKIHTSFSVFELTTEDGKVFYGLYYYEPEDNPNISKPKATGRTIQEEDGVLSIEDIKLDYLSLPQDKQDYEKAQLLIHEVKNGYWSGKEVYIILGKALEKAEYKFTYSSDIIITLDEQKKEVISFDASEPNYIETKIDWQYYMVHKHTGEKIDIDEFQPYSVKTTHWGYTIHTLKNAYTNNLRNLLGFNPQTWQLNYLKHEKRLNVVAGTRRAGKTLMSGYIICRSLMNHFSNRKHKMRQRKVSYVAINTDKMKDVKDYFNSLVSNVKQLNFIRYSSQDERYEFTNSRIINGNVIKELWGSCDFISSKSEEPGRGKGSDLFIFDEASFISNDVYDVMAPIIENERMQSLAISTINEENPKNWFYDDLIAYEQGIDPDGFSMRVTIDDIDTVIMDDEQKERAKRRLSKNPAKMYAELYATLAEETPIFSTGLFFNTSYLIKKPEAYVIWYDPARKVDFSAVEIAAIGYKDDEQGTIFNRKLCMEFIEETELSGQFVSQVEQLRDIKERYKQPGVPVYVIMDVTAAGWVVAEMMGDIIDYKVLYTTKKSVLPTFDSFGEMRYAKNALVKAASAMIDMRRVFGIGEKLPKLMKQMPAFKKIITQSGNITYNGTNGEHDDHVNAMMLAVFYISTILWEYATLGDELAKEWTVASREKQTREMENIIKSIHETYSNPNNTWNFRDRYRSENAKRSTPLNYSI